MGGSHKTVPLNLVIAFLLIKSRRTKTFSNLPRSSVFGHLAILDACCFKTPTSTCLKTLLLCTDIVTPYLLINTLHNIVPNCPQACGLSRASVNGARPPWNLLAHILWALCENTDLIYKYTQDKDTSFLSINLSNFIRSTWHIFHHFPPYGRLLSIWLPIGQRSEDMF